MTARKTPSKRPASRKSTARVAASNAAMTAPPPKLSVAEEAVAAITGDRREAYGDVEESFKRAADMWSLILGQDVTPEQFGLCMIALKISRQVGGKNQRDNFVDMIGYASLTEQVTNR